MYSNLSPSGAIFSGSLASPEIEQYEAPVAGGFPLDDRCDAGSPTSHTINGLDVMVTGRE
jgi:hypothetical protein